MNSYSKVKDQFNVSFVLKGASVTTGQAKVHVHSILPKIRYLIVSGAVRTNDLPLEDERVNHSTTTSLAY